MYVSHEGEKKTEYMPRATSLKSLDKVKANDEALGLAKETFLKAELSFVMSRLNRQCMCS